MATDLFTVRPDDIVDFEVVRVVSSDVASELALNKRQRIDDDA